MDEPTIHLDLTPEEVKALNIAVLFRLQHLAGRARTKEGQQEVDALCTYTRKVQPLVSAQAVSNE